MIKYIGFCVYHRSYQLWPPVIAHFSLQNGRHFNRPPIDANLSPTPPPLLPPAKEQVKGGGGVLVFCHPFRWP